MIGQGRRAEMKARFKNAMEAWDDHLAGCRDCLARGNVLCTEGMYLSGDVVAARSGLESVELREAHEAAAGMPATTDLEVAA
ncbi:MAG TPA: hypothetical protein VGV89_04610 [Thermoplasmata archaeon]|nr:hypothetical protein [Thermoplasmata archaeon]